MKMAALATFCCHDHGAKASGAVLKIATDQKENCIYSFLLTLIAKIYQSINNREK